MLNFAFLAALGAASMAPPAQGGIRSEALLVGATVVRPVRIDRLAGAQGLLSVSNAAEVVVEVDGGTIRQGAADSLLVTPGEQASMTITLHY